MGKDFDVFEEEERVRLRADTFLKGIIDFIKWSSTLAIAAILWIGNFTTSTVGLSRIISSISLFFLMCSLIIAILAARNVLNAWAKEWEAKQASHFYSVLDKLLIPTNKELARELRRESNTSTNNEWEKMG